MATTFQSGSVSGTAEQTSGEKTVSTYWATLEAGRFGYVPIILLIIGCVGGLAAGFAVQLGAWQLMSIVLPTMITLCLILALVPMKTIVKVGALALVCDLIFILAYSFSGY